MTEDRIPRKWEYIADQLIMLDAPQKVHNAAIEIDAALTDLDLDDITEPWREDFSNYRGITAGVDLLYSIIMDDDYCTACWDSGSECHICKLGDVYSCTPRSKFADLYFTIVRRWIEKQINRDI